MPTKTNNHYLIFNSTALPQPILQKINSGETDRADFLPENWQIKITKPKVPDSQNSTNPFVNLPLETWSQLSILLKIILRGRITRFSESLEQGIMKFCHDKNFKKPKTLAAFHFAHQLQVATLFNYANQELTTPKPYQKLADLALKDLQNLDKAIANLYDRQPLFSHFTYHFSVIEETLKNTKISTKNLAKTSASKPTTENSLFPTTNLPPTSLNFHRRTVPLSATKNPAKPVKQLLNYIFRFPDFRPSQIDGILQYLKNEDTITLLPTGSGKSIIYQMLALIRPGFGFVVDPIISLIDDQVDNLRRVGIDRVAGLSASTPHKAAIMQQIQAGEIFLSYFSPERLQIADFRAQMAELFKDTAPAVIAIDEAHCVSEWGHDFRTSYLNLAKTCRQITRGAPLLALTGTASPKVLTEMCSDLKIAKIQILKPQNFDRPELHFNVIESASAEKPQALARLLTEIIPQQFKKSPNQLYKLQQDQTCCGIIFCQHVGGEYGVTTVKQHLKTLGLSATEYYGQPTKTLYATSADAWSQQKQLNAATFKHNLVPLLVATKSFGMGVDKPNIRFTIHYGLPSSIEEYYQEAGRAGRDRDTAWSYIILSNDHQRRNQKILDPAQTSHAELLKIMQTETTANHSKIDQLLMKIKNKAKNSAKQLLTNAKNSLLDTETPAELGADDIDRLLHFHLNSFPGAEVEFRRAMQIFQKIQNSAATTIGYLPDSDEQEVEKSLHRLQTIGVINDYTVNFANNEYWLELNPVFKSPKRQDYINQTPVKLRELLAQTYQTLEPTRRQAINTIVRTMSKAAELPLNQQDAYLRTTILNYLN